MILGVVGAEAVKFTKKGEAFAKLAIARYRLDFQASAITSGHCHLGGVDIWAEEEAKHAGIFDPVLIFTPAAQSWTKGYMPRNIKIAQTCDYLLNIVVDVLPKEYTGMKFKVCYHCMKRNTIYDEHVKSGGCWTYWTAIEQFRKAGRIVIIPNY